MRRLSIHSAKPRSPRGVVLALDDGLAQEASDGLADLEVLDGPATGTTTWRALDLLVLIARLAGHVVFAGAAHCGFLAFFEHTLAAEGPSEEVHDHWIFEPFCSHGHQRGLRHCASLEEQGLAAKDKRHDH